MPRVALVLLFLLACLVSLDAPAQSASNNRTASDPGLALFNKHVYLVKVATRTGTRTLTGFRLKGVKGIVTALHGVADAAGDITVTSFTGERQGAVVKVAEIDLMRDLARLSSPDWEGMPDDGLELARGRPSYGQRVTVVGYPLNINQEPLAVTLEVGRPPIKVLGRLVDGQTRTRLQKRGSPDAELDILYLLGPLQPGHSGAPIVDGTDRVIAVGNGGLRKSSNIVWGIPWFGVQWSSLSAESLRKLQQEDNIEGLFSYDDEQQSAPIYVTAARGFSLFREQSSDSQIVKIVAPATDFEFSSNERTQNWVKVRLKDRTEGWAMAQDMSVVTPVEIGRGFGFRGDVWQLFFSAPQAVVKTGYGIDARFADAINRCKVSLDIAAYEINSRLVTDAILQAHRRGVKVRMVSSKESLKFKESTVSELVTEGTLRMTVRTGVMMHNKFAIMDGSRVWTGSWNATESGTYANNENEIVLEMKEAAAAYTARFERLLADENFRRQVKNRGDGSGAHYKLPNGIEVRFAPDGDTRGAVAAAIRSAKKSIKFMSFALTDMDVAGLLQEAAVRGIQVQGILEDRLAGSSLRANRQDASWSLLTSEIDALEVRLDGNPRYLHHNTIIVDDAIVITGSLNFSRMSFDSNDGNILILPLPELAAKYVEEFYRLWGVATKPPKTLAEGGAK